MEMKVDIKKLNDILKEEKPMIWITNINQSYFYIINGARPVDVNLNNNGLVAIAFMKEDTKELYEVWKKGIKLIDK